MGYEIDFLVVERESKSGDAITLRYGNLAGSRGEQTVVVIDGGYLEDGQAVVDHIGTYYGTDRIDLLISTHPDEDHVGGLTTVVEQMEVRRLWMHRPWLHNATLGEARRSAFRSLKFDERLIRSISQLSDLETLAVSKQIPIEEPFFGLTSQDGAISVWSPTQEYYESLLPEMNGQSASSAMGSVAQRVGAIVRKARETLHLERLTNDGETSPQNNSSVVSLLQVEGKQILFTADAGIPALDLAITNLEACGFKTGSLSLAQVSHHGSRHSVGPAVLDRLLGPKGQESTRASAIVSASSEGAPSHPSKMVTNAYHRRGYGVSATVGQTICCRKDQPARPGWVSIQPLPLYTEVEDED